MKTHRLSAAQFDELAAGGGDVDTVRLLKRAELSKRMLQMRVLLDHGCAYTERAYGLLIDIQQRAPDAVADILHYPQVGAWAATCLRQIRASADSNATLEFNLTYLGAITAVAAMRAGVEATATVPVSGGMVALPLLGCAEIGPNMLTGTGVVKVRSGRMEVEAAHQRISVPTNPESDALGWHGLRRLRAERGGYVLEVHLDDLDPFRDGHGLRVAARLPPSDIATWRRTLDDAWGILVRDHFDRAAAIAAGLTAIVPLGHQGDDRGLSATNTDAFGAVAMSLPGDALLLAEALVHEFQHAKLGALLGLVPLYDIGGDERYYAPWRDDPRPLGGLLQGAYAYLGVTEFWRRQLCVATRAEAAFAEFQFALWREQTERAADTLLASSRLTHLGVRFAEGMRAALAQWHDVSVGADTRMLADDAATDHTLVWRLRHMRPNHENADRFARAWLGKAPCPKIIMASTMDTTVRPGESIGRTSLRLRWVRSESAALYSVGDAVAAGIRGVTMADIAYVQRRYTEALHGYRAQVVVKPGNIEGWAGLSLTLRHVAPGPAADLLLARPELVSAVHRRVSELTGESLDPVDLATWLAGSFLG